MMSDYFIHSDIRKACTLPTSFYTDEITFDSIKEKVFARCWLYTANHHGLSEKNQYFPSILQEGLIDEPIIFSRDEQGKINCFSNVCTHRGAILVDQPGKGKTISCPYHGRCFHLNGQFRSMPEFSEAENFPRPEDNLKAIPFQEWKGLLFAGIDPIYSLDSCMQPIQERLSWLPLGEWEYRPELSKEYHVNANWALYCDNYLEGFHIPFVHPALNAALKFEDYHYELYKYANLQLGVAKENESCFDIPSTAVDAGKQIYAYYYFIFPNLMLNFYPWGLSLNLVCPIDIKKTKVSFHSYVYRNAGDTDFVSELDQTEMEDEAIVENVQRGMKSRFYQNGRFSPIQEKAVHHFHLLLANFLRIK